MDEPESNGTGVGMSPLEVRFLLHCYAVAEPFKSPLTQEMVDKFIGIGAIKQGVTSNTWDTTKLGDAWCKIICDTPIPTQAYVDAHGKVIVPR